MENILPNLNSYMFEPVDEGDLVQHRVTTAYPSGYAEYT